jgi:hypothetical protein
VFVSVAAWKQPPHAYAARESKPAQIASARMDVDPSQAVEALMWPSKKVELALGGYACDSVVMLGGARSLA